jgi:hypothetical protein
MLKQLCGDIMKVKQKVEQSGRFVEPDTQDILVPEMVVCPECGYINYPREEDKGRTYYFPNMSAEHRYHTRHYARATFTCSDCGCKFSRTVDTYTEFNWDKIKLDIAKVLIVLSIIAVFLCSVLKLGDNEVVRLIVGVFSYATFLGSVIYYWRKSS